MQMTNDASAAVGLVPGILPDPGSILLLVITMCAFLVPMVIVYPPVPPRPSDALRETHSKLGLGEEDSNLRDQHSPRHRSSGAGDAPPKVCSLWIYPVKSCRGIEVTKAKVLPSGLEFDRLFTMAQLRRPGPAATQSDDPEKRQDRWEFITQRQFPLLATVEVELWQPDLEKLKRQDFKPSESFLILRFPWQAPGLRGLLSLLAAKLGRGWSARAEKEVMLPVAFPSKREIGARGYAYSPVRIWNETPTALNMGSELPPELQTYLGVKTSLSIFRIDPSLLREVYRCAPTRDDAGYQPVTAFQDAYPLHIINLSSVQDLDSKLNKDQSMQDLDVRRFRANIIITGNPAYEEETWKLIRLKPSPGSTTDECEFHVSCRTVRCKMPNVDPITGVRHPVEPDKSLRAYRNVDEGAPKHGCLGMQLCPLFAKTAAPGDLESLVDVGMMVEVEERGEHVYISQ